MIKRITQIFFELLDQINSRSKYLIVDYNEDTKLATVLCNGTRAFFTKSLFEISHDDHIISGLDPRQSCYIGIKIGELLDIDMERFKPKKASNSNHVHNTNKTVDVTFDRYGNLLYVNKKTKKLVCANAIDIAKNDKLIVEFDSAISYAIGLFIGKSIRKKYFDEIINGSEKEPSNVVSIGSVYRSRE